MNNTNKGEALLVISNENQNDDAIPISEFRNNNNNLNNIIHDTSLYDIHQVDKINTPVGSGKIKKLDLNPNATIFYPTLILGNDELTP